MSIHAKKIIAMLDDLALRLESKGEFEVAAKLDTISQLVVTADKELPAKISFLAEDLKVYFPHLDTEEALHISKMLHEQYEKKEDEETGEEKEGIFPISALPFKYHREGPRPQDVPEGKAEWWDPEA